MKKAKWYAVLAACMVALLAAGCKNSSDGSDSVPVAKVTLNETALTLPVGGTATLKATVEPDDADDKTVTWSSSKEAVATVDKDGKVTAVAEGTAIITAKAGGKSATCAITVKSVAVTAVELEPTTLSLTVGETEELKVRVMPNEASDVTVLWSSSNAEVATVDNDGTVTAVKAGKATITAKAGDKTATCEVTVNVHTHYYVDWKCECGLVKPSLDDGKGKIDEWGRLTKYEGTKTELDIPEGVSSIGSSAFKDCTGLTKVTIGEDVTEIGYYAFDGCTSLASVTIPNSVTKIGSSVFRGCTNLKEIQFNGTKEQWNAIEGSDTVEVPGIRCTDGSIGVLGVPAYLTVSGTKVTGCDKDTTTVVIPDGVTEIGKEAFSDCKNLVSVKISGSVTSIEEYAFYSCRTLNDVTIPASVTSIGEHAFLYCDRLKEIQFDGTTAQWNAIEGSDTVEVPGIRCTDGSIGVLGVPAYLTVSGTKVTGCDEDTTTVVIPDGITSIGRRAFLNCASLASVTLPNSVTEIGDSAFYGCTSLTEVTIPDTVTSIESNAFRNCSSLKEVTIPKGVTEISTCAFMSCKDLASVTIPESVTKIMEYAFYGCTSLASITYKGTKAQWEAITGYGKSDLRGKVKTITCTDGEVTVE